MTMACVDKLHLGPILQCFDMGYTSLLGYQQKSVLVLFCEGPQVQNIWKKGQLSQPMLCGK